MFFCFSGWTSRVAALAGVSKWMSALSDLSKTEMGPRKPMKTHGLGLVVLRKAHNSRFRGHFR